MKTMVIGIPPDYLYPGELSEWKKNNTYFAANLGASFITNALIKQFSAEYVDIKDFGDISRLRNEYDTCLLALATHIHPNRDISIFADLLEKLDIKTVVISAGIKDFQATISLDYKIHPSVTKILHLASESSQWIGVRGHYTATVLRNNGFKNIVPIGCPSMYWNLNENLKIERPLEFLNPLVVYHQSIAFNSLDAIKKYPLLGQDFQDQLIFTDTLVNDKELKNYLERAYSRGGRTLQNRILDAINSNGHFFFGFKQWFDYIGQHDHVVGARLHGTIAALVQKIPSILVMRDLRTREMSEFLRIPSVSFDYLNRNSIEKAFYEVDFSDFNRVYRLRYHNYVKLLDDNALRHNLACESDTKDFSFMYADLENSISIPLSAISGEIRQLKRQYRPSFPRRALRRLSKYFKLIPRQIDGYRMRINRNNLK